MNGLRLAPATFCIWPMRTARETRTSSLWMARRAGRMQRSGQMPMRATWTTALQRLSSAGVTTNQVEAIWLKQALAGPANYGIFPGHAQALEHALATILRVAK